MGVRCDREAQDVYIVGNAARMYPTHLITFKVKYEYDEADEDSEGENSDS
jgi:hypothetical protein